MLACITCAHKHERTKPARMSGGCRIHKSWRRMTRSLADWQGTVLVPGPLDLGGIWYSAIWRCTASGMMPQIALGPGKTFITTCSTSTTFDPNSPQTSMMMMDRKSSASTGFRILMARRRTHILHHSTKM